MLIDFINSAMKNAHYELLEGGEGFYGEIPGFNGVWANSDNLDGCRKELQEVLEEWIVLKIRKNSFIPRIENYDLNKILCEN